jgi:sulfonate transport system permease protein
VPSVVSGLRLALAQAWLFLVAAELLGASMGLGWMLNDSQQTGRVDRILLAIVLLALLGTISNAILVVFEKAVLKRWL